MEYRTTTATGVQFKNLATGKLSNATVSSGAYSTTLANPGTYSVTLFFSVNACIPTILNTCTGTAVCNANWTLSVGYPTTFSQNDWAC